MLARQHMHEHKLAFDGRFLYQERWVLSTAVLYESDVWLSRFDDAATSTQYGFCEKCPYLSLSCFVVSVLMDLGDDK